MKIAAVCLVFPSAGPEEKIKGRSDGEIYNREPSEHERKGRLQLPLFMVAHITSYVGAEGAGWDHQLVGVLWAWKKAILFAALTPIAKAMWATLFILALRGMRPAAPPPRPRAAQRTELPGPGSIFIPPAEAQDLGRAGARAPRPLDHQSRMRTPTVNPAKVSSVILNMVPASSEIMSVSSNSMPPPTGKRKVRLGSSHLSKSSSAKPIPIMA